MSAYIIGVVNQKGGAGKTTTSYNVAVGLAKNGFRVAIVDADPQNTLVKLAARAPEEQPFPVAVMNLAASGGRLTAMLRNYVSQYDYIIIDGPPSQTAPQTQGAIGAADLVLIPTSPSILELESSAETAVVIKEKMEERDPFPVAVVLNRTNHTRVHKVGVADAERQIGFPMLPVSLRQRTSYQEMALLGLSVLDSGDVDAVDDIQLLCKAILYIQENGKIPSLDDLRSKRKSKVKVAAGTR